MAKKTLPTNRARKLEKGVMGYSVIRVLARVTANPAQEKRFQGQPRLAKTPCIPRFSRSFNRMRLSDLNVLLAMGQPTQPGQQAPPFWTSLVPLVLLVVVFYFALIRPQQKKQKEQAQLLKTVRPGDKVVTASGIIGIVVSVKEKSLSIRSADTKLEITKSAVAEITERSGESSES